MTLARETIPKLPKLPQAQYGLQEQLEELHMAAARLGLYDADDWLMDRLHPERRPPMMQAYAIEDDTRAADIARATETPSKPLNPPRQ